VYGGVRVVRGIVGVHALGDWVHELRKDARAGMGGIKVGTVKIGIGCKTESVQFPSVVEDAVGEEVIAVHVRTQIVPVVLSHCVEALSLSPFSGCECILIPGNVPNAL
jgi:hypothetical protein